MNEIWWNNEPEEVVQRARFGCLDEKDLFAQVHKEAF
jgi:hypothetical protein